jgi:hypothetical protein
MLGEKIGELSGKVTSQRVLPNPGGGPKMETSHQISGKLLGIEAKETATYWSVVRQDGTLYGEGQGVAMGKEGDLATWIGQGVGTIGKAGAVSFRGAVYYQSSSPRWSRLNSVAAIFEYEVDGQGNSRSQLWQQMRLRTSACCQSCTRSCPRGLGSLCGFGRKPWLSEAAYPVVWHRSNHRPQEKFRRNNVIKLMKAVLVLVAFSV